MTPMEMAAIENAAARRKWGARRSPNGTNVAKQIKQAKAEATLSETLVVLRAKAERDAAERAAKEAAAAALAAEVELAAAELAAAAPKPLTPMELAALENAAARRSWGVPIDGRSYKGKSIAEKVRPLIGTGISRKEAARRLDCSAPAITQALRKIGGKL